MSLRYPTLAALAVLLPALALAGCSENALSPDGAPSAEADLEALFAEAAAAYDVPAPLLEAIAYTETRWQMVEGEEEFEGVPAAFGVMALRGDRLREGARLAGVTEPEARAEAGANIRAAAALLRSWADADGTPRASVEDWADLVVRYSGIEVEAAQAEYARDGVYGVLRTGAEVTGAEGRVVGRVDAISVDAELRGVPAREARLARSADYGPAIWRPSPNYSSRPSGTSAGMVIIHTCEGSYSSCWSWLTNSASGVSAHYVVNESGSEVSQLVRDSQKAWHIGASYNCSLNGNTDCSRNGQSSNNFTIGIEHGGYASQSSFPTGQIQASAELGCDISQSWNIARDRYHFVAHGTLQPYNRTDPGPNWPWTDYMNRINTACGTGGGGGSQIIVDSNNSLNDTSVGYIQTSSNWTASSHSTDYETGYWWAQTASVSDGATFWFYLPSAATKTIDAWWVSGTNRAPSAPFIVYNASGSQLATKYVNMQANGGKWNTLGSYNFTAGWNKVVLSRWTTSGYVVIADALRIR